MARYHLSKLALRDLEEIRRYLTTEASPTVADHVEDALFEGFEELVRLPWIGHRHPSVRGASLLFYSVFNYVIVFRRQEKRIVILRGIHGARDLGKLF